ncbi:dethiobiotin synthase [Fulvivirgaceae bacterium BMA12]|uniref:ATP-dependent dethiobiotin synthetase BioD n=1 Tax=Agaribacillus aureus TaxID=3051825 RepID=A0ABT8KZN6_9BACT|nr:dethiobiotin synthase [Fulvivirgaceae bacterium BMA12]
MNNYFVSAIGTDSGKTLVSAIICQALGADYWKPVQCGFPRDLETVQGLVQDPRCNFYKEQYLLKTPASPHAAAKIDDVQLSVANFRLPATKNDLVIEGAGGLLVPLNDEENIVDLIGHFEAAVVLVSDLYLGSINHTLMSVEVLKSRNLKVKGIIFNGPENKESQTIILKRSGFTNLFYIPQESQINADVVARYANELKAKWEI